MFEKSIEFLVKNSGCSKEMFKIFNEGEVYTAAK